MALGIYGLAGLRIGYSIATPSITSILNTTRQPFNMNAFALAVGSLVFRETGYVTQTVQFITRERDRICAQFDAWNLGYILPSANFIMMEFKNQADDIFNHLLENGVLIRQLKNYQLPDHLRVSIGTAEDNNRFLDALNSVFNT